VLEQHERADQKRTLKANFGSQLNPDQFLILTRLT